MIIYVFFKDIGQHHKPHVHVTTESMRRLLALRGNYRQALCREQLKIITGWLAFHENEAYKAWNLAVQGEHFDKIPPMKLGDHNVCKG